LGVKKGGAHADVTTLLNNAESLFAKLSAKMARKIQEVNFRLEIIQI